jgi:thioesterase domain-containing protein
LQAIGLDGSAEPSEKLEEIAAQYVSEILASNIGDSVALAGYSFGGTIALEMARQLKAKGKNVIMLAMFDAYNASGENFESKQWKFAKKILRQIPKAVFIVRSLMKYPVETVRYQQSILAERLRSFFKLKRDIAVEKENPYSDKIYRKYETAYDNYRLPVYDGAIDVFKVKKRLYFVDDRKYLGWKPYARDGVKVHEISGDHKTFLLSPYDREFAKILQRRLNECSFSGK